MSYRVYIGIGHGGTDPGAVSAGYKEKDIALSIGKSMQAELKRHGVNAKISRDIDETEKLADKIKECNAFRPDLAVDVHINAGGGDGFEVFHHYKGGTGKVMAQKIEAEVKAIGQNSRGLKTRLNENGEDYFGFIRQTVCPAVILEYGFIDNAKDRSQFDELDEQEAIGIAYAHGVLKTLGIAIKKAAVLDYAKEVQKKTGLSNDSIAYLKKYKYADELFRKLHAAM